MKNILKQFIGFLDTWKWLLVKEYSFRKEQLRGLTYTQMLFAQDPLQIKDQDRLLHLCTGKLGNLA